MIQFERNYFFYLKKTNILQQQAQKFAKIGAILLNKCIDWDWRVRLDSNWSQHGTNIIRKSNQRSTFIKNRINCYKKALIIWYSSIMTRRTLYFFPLFRHKLKHLKLSQCLLRVSSMQISSFHRFLLIFWNVLSINLLISWTLNKFSNFFGGCERSGFSK